MVRYGLIGPFSKYGFLSSSKNRKNDQYLAYVKHTLISVEELKYLKKILFSRYPDTKNISLCKDQSWKSEMWEFLLLFCLSTLPLGREKETKNIASSICDSLNPVIEW